jgi:formate-nitrite transporter family protein
MSTISNIRRENPKAQQHSEPVEVSEGAVSTREEEKKVQERLAIGAHVVYETIRREGEDELSRTVSALAWSALAAGLSMGFSFITEAMLMAYLPNESWRPLVSRLGYSVGFLIVVLGRQQLFTENTLTVVLPFLVRKDASTFLRMLRLWGVVLVCNLAGTFLFSLAIAHINVLEPGAQSALKEIALHHLGASFGIVVVRAIFAGWLIALMVWLLPAADSARVGIIIILTYLIGIGGFNHIIAGSTVMFYLVADRSISFGTYLVQFFIPTLAGNIIGGLSLVTALNHAQVVGGKES